MNVTYSGMFAPPPVVDDAFSKMPSAESVSRLESIVLDAPQVDLETSHVIHEGVCSRTIFIKAGTVLTGAKTNLPNICIVSGDITVTTDEGPKRLAGYHVLKASAGFKRAGYAHADTYWTTIWTSELTDIAELEDEMTNESFMLQTRRAGIVYEAPKALEVD